jgi:ADP-ribose pyrophosphatase YjhB (NUDIX family)
MSPRDKKFPPSPMTVQLHTVSVAVLGVRQQHVALVRVGDAWALPQASVPTGAAPAETALRILHEQTGLTARLDRVNEACLDEHGILIVYWATVDEGASHAAVSFFAPDHLPTELVSPTHAKVLQAWAKVTRPVWPWQARFCLRCGSAQLSLQERFGRDRLTCEVCGYIFFRDPKIGAGVFIVQDGKVLLIQRGVNPGMDLWCFPSGFMEHDETPESAAVREAKEETGLDVTLDELMGLHSYLDPARGNGILVLYQAHAVGGTLTPGDDAKGVRYFAPNELPPPSEIAFRTHRLVLQAWRSKHLNKQGK